MLSQLAEIYRDGQLINDALTQAAERASADRPQHEQQLAGVRADIQALEHKIDRYLQAFEEAKLDPDVCQQRIERHHTRLQALRDQEDQLAHTLAACADTSPDTANLAAVADRLDQLIATASPEQAKELLKVLIKDIRVHGPYKIIPTYRVPAAVRTIRGSMDLVRLFSNPTGPLKTLLEGPPKPPRPRARCAARPIAAQHRRAGWIVEAIVRVLADRQKPMQAKAIHAAVEVLLGESVRWCSVKAALAANVAGPSPRFVRVARGRYRLAQT